VSREKPDSSLPTPYSRLRAGFDKRWLLPLGVLTASALVALGLIIFGPSFVGGSFGEGVARPAASEAAVADCSGASKLDYACHQERYRNLVLNSGVEAAFADLKDERERNGFVRAACHQMTHVIGRTAVELYGDLAGAYARGDPICSAGYYHGATEAVMAKIGPDKVVEEADTVCADLRENQRYSTYHYNCVHGMGHGFMGVFQTEVFESLEACDALEDGWEKDQCYGGVFMENLSAMDNPDRPSKYLRPDQPLYPCTVVEDRYKNMCYDKQTAYAVYTQNEDFAKVFDLCATVAEDYSRPACYKGLGGKVAAHSNKHVIGETAKADSARKLCMLGEDNEARSNCVMGVVETTIRDYHGYARAKAFCESLDMDLRVLCLKTSEDENLPD
jgi:hypothetical protein